jgi:hypothetical protein
VNAGNGSAGKRLRTGLSLEFAQMHRKMSPIENNSVATTFGLGRSKDLRLRTWPKTKTLSKTSRARNLKGKGPARKLSIFRDFD